MKRMYAWGIAVGLAAALAFGGCQKVEDDLPVAPTEEVAAASEVTPSETAEETPVVQQLPDVTTEMTTRNGVDCLLQTAVLDMDGDGEDETIKAYFTCENVWYVDVDMSGIYDTCEIVISKAGGQEFMTEWNYDAMIPVLNLAKIDEESGLVHFYLAGDGPSADPYTRVFSFDGMQIAENAGFPGYLVEYDWLGRLFSGVNVNSYYDLNGDLQPLPKDNIVGTTIQRDMNLLLMTSPGRGFTEAVMSNWVHEMDMSEMDFADEFICIVPPNTPLEVLDIEFLPGLWSEELYYIPWIQVRTPEGVEGWFSIIYGD